MTSQNYPNNYEPSTKCEWLLRTEPTHTLAFQFTDFDLEDSANCSTDSVKIYDGAEIIESRLLMNVCGSQIRNTTGFSSPLKSQSNEMLIVMETNDNVQAKGFSAQYEMVK